MPELSRRVSARRFTATIDVLSANIRKLLHKRALKGWKSDDKNAICDKVYTQIICFFNFIPLFSYRIENLQILSKEFVEE